MSGRIILTKSFCGDGELATRATRLQFQALLLQHVQADQAELADVFLDQIRNVVVAHEQDVERHVLAGSP